MNTDWQHRRNRTAQWKADQQRPITPDLLVEKAAWVKERAGSHFAAVAFAHWKAATGSTAKDVALWSAVAAHIEREGAGR